MELLIDQVTLRAKMRRWMLRQANRNLIAGALQVLSKLGHNTFVSVGN